MSASKKMRKFPKQGTIGNIVLTALAKNPAVTADDLKAGILKKFPDSKFGPSHVAWYKHQVKVGNYVLPEDTAVKPAKTKKTHKTKDKKTGKKQTVAV